MANLFVIRIKQPVTMNNANDCYLILIEYLIQNSVTEDPDFTIRVFLDFRDHLAKT